VTLCQLSASPVPSASPPLSLGCPFVVVQAPPSSTLPRCHRGRDGRRASLRAGCPDPPPTWRHDPVANDSKTELAHCPHTNMLRSTDSLHDDEIRKRRYRIVKKCSESQCTCDSHPRPRRQKKKQLSDNITQKQKQNTHTTVPTQCTQFRANDSTAQQIIDNSEIAAVHGAVKMFIAAQQGAATLFCTTWCPLHRSRDSAMPPQLQAGRPNPVGDDGTYVDRKWVGVCWYK